MWFTLCPWCDNLDRVDGNGIWNNDHRLLCASLMFMWSLWKVCDGRGSIGACCLTIVMFFKSHCVKKIILFRFLWRKDQWWYRITWNGHGYDVRGGYNCIIEFYCNIIFYWSIMYEPCFFLYYKLSIKCHREHKGRGEGISFSQRTYLTPIMWMAAWSGWELVLELWNMWN